MFPNEDCHDSQEYGCPASERDVTNLTPISAYISSSPSTMGAFDWQGPHQLALISIKMIE